MLGLDDGTVVVVKVKEEQVILVGIANFIVGGGTGIGWIDVCVGFGHGIFARSMKTPAYPIVVALGLAMAIDLVMYWFSFLRTQVVCTLGWLIKRSERAPGLATTSTILLMMGVDTNGGTTRREWCTQ